MMTGAGDESDLKYSKDDESLAELCVMPIRWNKTITGGRN